MGAALSDGGLSAMTFCCLVSQSECLYGIRFADGPF